MEFYLVYSIEHLKRKKMDLIELDWTERYENVFFFVFELTTETFHQTAET